jgi:hypothetical protein
MDHDADAATGITTPESRGSQNSLGWGLAILGGGKLSPQLLCPHRGGKALSFENLLIIAASFVHNRRSK